MNHYERLGAEKGADFTALKKAYYRRVKECHPDLHGNAVDKTEEFKLLVAAFDILSDPDRRRVYDESLGATALEGEAGEERRSERFEYVERVGSVMDTEADDTLEELIVGNSPPEGSTLATLFMDLEKTLVFMSFREAKNLYARRRHLEALRVLRRVVAMSPGNILYRTYLARTLVFAGDLSGAKTHYKAALALGARRIPPQNLAVVKRELDAVSKMKNPLLHRLANYFFGPRALKSMATEEELIEEANRAMARLSREELSKGRKRLK